MPRPQSPKGAYNKVFPDKEIKERFFFQVNQTTNKLALYERTENGILHNVDFGSIVTDEFVSTVPMGSLKYRHPDGYDYHVCRVSPTGDSKSAVLGNYASKTYVASNIDGTWLAYENQKQYTKTIQSNETELVTGKTFIVPIETDIDSMAYSIDITVGTGQSSYISRTAWNDLNGKVLYDTISVEAWGGSSNPGWLSDHGAEYVDLSDTSTTLDFAHPFPIVAGEQFKHEVHFKEDVTMLCSKGTNTLVGTINYEELLLEQVASREWVTQRLLGVSVKDVDYEVDTFAQLPTNPTDQNSSGLIIAYVNNSTGVLFAKKKMGYYVYESNKWVSKGKAYNIPQVTTAEKSAGTETEVRRFSPKDVADMGGATFKELPKGAGTHVLTVNTTYVPDTEYQYENERYTFEDKAGTVKIRGKLTFILNNDTPFFEIEQSTGNYNRATMTLDLSDCYLFNNPMGFQQGVFIRKSCGNVVIERSQISLRSGTFIENVAYNWVYKPDVITKCNILIYDSLFEQIFYNQKQRFVTLIIKDNTIHMSGRLVYIWYSQPHYRHFDVSGNYIKNWGKLGTIHSDYYNPSNPALDLGAVFRFCDNQIELIQGYSLIWYNAHANLLTHGNLNIENNRVKSNYSRLNNVNELHYADPRSVCHTMDGRLVKGIGVLPAMNAYNYSEGVTGRKYKGKPIYRTEVDGTRSFGSTLTENNINGVTEVVDCKLTYTDGAANKYRYTVNNMYISSSQQARIGVDTAGAYSGWLRLWVAGYSLKSAWVEFIR